jgi:spore coat polysaccharide biosynthesis predicted glycosyltransferase SpsG
MHVVFFCEYGNIEEIGFGHLYRTKTLMRELERKGHTSEISQSYDKANVFVVDHMKSQSELLRGAKERGIKTVLIDGDPDDVQFADISISAFVNYASEYKGLDYLVFPLPQGFYFYDTDKNNESKKIFISMGGYDANKYTALAVRASFEMGFTAVVPKNNSDMLQTQYSNVIIYGGDDYYEAMIDCFAAITNGGLSMFQTLYFGVPTIAIPQYEHQGGNIRRVEHFCVPSLPDLSSIKSRLSVMIEDGQMRRDLNYSSCRSIDDQGPKRVVRLIESMM